MPLLLIGLGLPAAELQAADPEIMKRITLPLVDLAAETHRQSVVDREPGQYLGHVTTVLLGDGKTIIAVYPRGHGTGPIVMKRSSDGGRTWSARLPTPASWATSRETPTIHGIEDATGRRRLILWSGLYPARFSLSAYDGNTWSELRPAGEWGGIVVMGSLLPLRTGRGHYLALFHDDGRFFAARPKLRVPPVFTVYATRSRDGGLTWSAPDAVFSSSAIHLCEPEAVRSPDGRQIAVLLRENSRRRNSHVIFSSDEGRNWTLPRPLPLALTGDRHTAAYAPDGRLVITFRDRTVNGPFGAGDMDKLGAGSPTEGDWVAWVGSYDDLAGGREGYCRIRIMDNRAGWDAAYPGLEVLPDGTFVATSYGHWTSGEPPYIVSVRFTLAEIDARLKKTAE